MKIIYYSETIDNWGRTRSSDDGHIIYNILNNPEEWTDDMVFEDDKGNQYYIDELVGQTVSVPEIGIFRIPNE